MGAGKDFSKPEQTTEEKSLDIHVVLENSPHLSIKQVYGTSYISQNPQWEFSDDKFHPCKVP